LAAPAQAHLNRDVTAKSQDLITNQIKRCRDLAAFALLLYRDHHDLGLPWERIHVDPDAEYFKEQVMTFEGTERELYDAVMGDCMGTQT
jgi:hypothetical protein